MRVTYMSASENSVTGPYIPRRPSNAAGNVTPFNRPWVNTDYPLAPQPVRFDAPRRVELPESLKPVVQEPVVETKKPLSLWRKLLAITGVASISLGVVGGLVSMVALGPFGIVVAAGAAAIGCFLIGIGTKQ